jgi:hypothetical protein
MIKVTLGEKPQEEKPYPKFMKNKASGKIFYFHRKCVGLPLEEPEMFNDDPRWVCSWVMVNFEDFNGKITSQNA